MDDKKQEYIKELAIKKRDQDKDAKERQVKASRYDLTLPGRNIEITVYLSRPEDPVIFCFYGGGFILGTHILDDELWTMMHERLSATIISVGYRRAPENPYPAALDDAYDTVKYVEENKEVFGITGSDFSVCGNSAGANLAAAVCFLNSQRGQKLIINRQILMYPYVDLATAPEMKGHRKEDRLKYTMYAECYLNGKDPYDPYVSPLYAASDMLALMPRTIAAVAERDPLQAEGCRFVSRLRAEGVSVDSMVAKDMFHGYLEHCFKPVNPTMDPLMIEQMENKEVYRRTVETIDFIGNHF